MTGPPRKGPVFLRRRLIASAMNRGYEGLSRLGRRAPPARLHRHGVFRTRDVPYRADTGDGAHRLDVYRPEQRNGPLPVVFYVHGGGFQSLSKDTHWLMALAFARRGYLVFIPDYRLAPRHPFPAAVQDVCAAWEWVTGHLDRFGGDPERVALVGESAGANLVSALSLATSYRRTEPWARRAFEAPVRPGAVAPLYGMLQVSDSERFLRRRALPRVVSDILVDVEAVYLRHPIAATIRDLADPLVAYERGDPPDRPIPPFYLAVGTRDPLLDDTRRMAAALDRLGVPCDVSYFPGEVHAFNAFPWRSEARRCWREVFGFLDRTISTRAGAPPAHASPG